MGISTSVPLPSVPSLPAIGGGATQNPAKPFLDLMSNAFQARARSQKELDSLTTDFESFLTDSANENFSNGLGKASADSLFTVLDTAQESGDTAKQLFAWHGLLKDVGGADNLNSLDAGRYVAKMNARLAANREDGLTSDEGALATARKFKAAMREFHTEPVLGLVDEDNQPLTIDKPNGRILSDGSKEQMPLHITYATLPTFIKSNKKVRDAVLRSSTPEGLALLQGSGFLKGSMFYDPEANTLDGSEGAAAVNAATEAIRADMSFFASRGGTNPKTLLRMTTARREDYDNQAESMLMAARQKGAVAKRLASIGVVAGNPLSAANQNAAPSSRLSPYLSNVQNAAVNELHAVELVPTIQQFGAKLEPSSGVSEQDQKDIRGSYTSQIYDIAAPLGRDLGKVFLQSALNDPSLFGEDGRVDFVALRDQAAPANSLKTSLGNIAANSEADGSKLTKILRSNLSSFSFGEMGTIAKAVEATTGGADTGRKDTSQHALNLLNRVDMSQISRMSGGTQLLSEAIQAHAALKDIDPGGVNLIDPNNLRKSLERIVSRNNSLGLSSIPEAGILLGSPTEGTEGGTEALRVTKQKIGSALTKTRAALGSGFDDLTEAEQSQFTLGLALKNPLLWDDDEKVREEFLAWNESNDSAAQARRAFRSFQKSPVSLALQSALLKKGNIPPEALARTRLSVRRDTGNAEFGDEELRRTTSQEIRPDLELLQAQADRLARSEALDDVLPQLSRSISGLSSSALVPFQQMLTGFLGGSEETSLLVASKLGFITNASDSIAKAKVSLDVVDRLRSGEDNIKVPGANIVKRSGSDTVFFIPRAPDGTSIPAAIDSFANIDQFERSIVDDNVRDRREDGSVVLGALSRAQEAVESKDLFVNSEQARVLLDISSRLRRLRGEKEKEEAVAEEGREGASSGTRAALGGFTETLEGTKPTVAGRFRLGRLREVETEINRIRERLGTPVGTKADRRRISNLLQEADELAVSSELTTREQRFRRAQDVLASLQEKVRETARRALRAGNFGAERLSLDVPTVGSRLERAQFPNFQSSPEGSPLLEELRALQNAELSLTGARAGEAEIPSAELQFSLEASEKLIEDLKAASERLRAQITPGL